ncbi:hypothetical protein BH780_gp202 [Bacillus phage Eldridge]|uniref:Phage protein n=1 Tax=Bacillus phage Eldridge TaxID=1776293 RepID=A0A0Y0AGR3_9CAUD|nr:hypothetical protein BH780_gp202 [Bacillus phage Eldridge]AMB18785.1 hypothetical protein Eldridge_0205 [Bacillus phage Eldridge]
MEIYLLVYDNGKDYEQNYTCNLGVIDSMSKVKEFVESKGFYPCEDSEDSYCKVQKVDGILFDEEIEYIFVEKFTVNTIEEGLV